MLNNVVKKRLDIIRDHYDTINDLTKSARIYRKMLAHYYSRIIPPDSSVLEVGCGDGELLAHLSNRDVTGVDLSEKQVKKAREKIPYGMFYFQAGEILNISRTYDYIILSDTINQAADVQTLLSAALKHSHSGTRLILNFFSSLWRPFINLATILGMRHKSPTSNWLSTKDVKNLLELSGWQVIKFQPRIICPVQCFGFERLLNRLLAPLFSWLCLSVFCVALPWSERVINRTFSVSVIVPARNEAGNIEEAVLRIPQLGRKTELIFVEGHSHDITWREIKRVKAKYPDREIKILQQTGEGKGNAVREGFSAASGDILMVLDADLTTPPEELPKFYDVLASGHAEFANGVRLVYPMEEKAMRFLNMIGNKLFCIIFSWILNQPVKDTLCGTKALFKHDYDNIVINRNYFGEFDPFGDFDLIFGADKMNLKIVDIPIRYQERHYGDTNIKRWRHGWLLLKMVIFGACKLKFI